MSSETAVWTIDRLARLAAAALSAESVAAQPNGRIREVPDVRTIRWYTSIGLLDRPAAMRGRTALYGRRHLAQLVAIKRLQAAGLTLTEVQESLLGADTAAVERIAELPGDVEGLITDTPPDGESDSVITAGSNGVAESAYRTRFWSARPASTSSPEPAAASAPTPAPDTAPLISGVRLTPDVTLLLASGRVPGPDDRAAIAEAAQPLLALLRRLGLTEP
ncbi:MAG: MerR family transcriptional regulator [Catenulispora sp.]